MAAKTRNLILQHWWRRFTEPDDAASHERSIKKANHPAPFRTLKFNLENSMR